jgi:Rrf2 family iron-sulfur cluster assembly transcriptional regulator
MLLSKTSRYALRAATYLAAHRDDDRAIPVAEIAEGAGVPRNYLSKTLHQMARQGVLLSERGPKGGFRLAADPARITLREVIEPVEPSLSERRCLLDRATCSDVDPCAAHERWQQLAAEYERFLDETHLADLVHAD